MTDQVVSELHERRLEALRYALGPVVLAALADPDVVEVMLNDDGRLFVDACGKMAYAGDISADDAIAILNQVSSALNGELSQENPVVEGELPLNSERFEGVAPPVVERAIFAIRKKATQIFSLSSYVKSGVLSFAQAEQLRAAVLAEKNILVAGAAGSGKTTFCNALLHELSILAPDTRMILLEDTRELQCALINKTFLRATQWTSFARLAVVVNRLRPDRISVGETRDGAPTLSLLKLWNTGHSGGFTTLHANSAYEALTRVDQLIQEVSAVPQRSLIGAAINLVVFLDRKGGARKVKEIIRVSKFDSQTERFIVESVM